MFQVETKNWMDTLTTVLLTAALVLVAMSPVAYAIYKRTPPEVAVVDLQKLVEEDQTRLLEVLGSSNLDQKRDIAERMTADFAKKLSATVETLGNECHCVLVNKAALLGGTAIDYTNEVRRRLK